jgi:hypothetical protein
LACNNRPSRGAIGGDLAGFGSDRAPNDQRMIPAPPVLRRIMRRGRFILRTPVMRTTFTRTPFVRIWLAIAGLSALGGCAADIPVEQPTMYHSMAEAGARLDPEAAASMISLYRNNNGLAAVAIDPELMKLAEGQSQAMASRNKLDHDVKAPLPKRLQAAGYPATLAVENVSAGYHTLAEAFSGWRDSPPHRANMLQGGVTRMGIAASYAPNTKYKVFWTLILASTEPRDAPGRRGPSALLAN